MCTAHLMIVSHCIPLFHVQDWWVGSSTHSPPLIWTYRPLDIPTHSLKGPSTRYTHPPERTWYQRYSLVNRHTPVKKLPAPNFEDVSFILRQITVVPSTATGSREGNFFNV